MHKQFKAALIFRLLLLSTNAFSDCTGYPGPGGPCYTGPGGPCYSGPGGGNTDKWNRVSRFCK